MIDKKLPLPDRLTLVIPVYISSASSGVLALSSNRITARDSQPLKLWMVVAFMVGAPLKKAIFCFLEMLESSLKV